MERRTHALYDEGKITDMCTDAPFQTRWQRVMQQVGGEQPRRSWDDEVVCEALFDLLAHPTLLDSLEPLIGTEIVATGIIAVRPKIPGDKRTTVLWHQDSHYFGQDAASHRIITAWLPLVNTDETNGCMRVIPGSHQWGYQQAEMDEEHHAYRPLEDPSLRGDVVECPMRVGDVLIFNLLMHCSGANTSDHIRWSVDFRYLSPQAQFERLRDFLPSFLARSRSTPDTVDDWPTWKRRMENFREASA